MSQTQTQEVQWFVKLSDGNSFYQDDQKYGVSSWEVLKYCIRHNHLRITNVYVKFFDHVEEVTPPNSPAYYFIRASIAELAFGYTRELYLFGHEIEPNTFLVRQWIVPEIIPLGQEIRHTRPDDPCIIRNFNVS